MSHWSLRGARKALPLAAALCVCAPAAAAQDLPGWIEIHPWRGPCAGNCAAAIYGGWAVENSMTQIFLTSPETPITWDYHDDHLVATAVSRRIATLWRRVDVEPELGLGQRFGAQDETEVWGAVFLRYRGFPWDGVVVTSVAVSSGFNYASAISQQEVDRARDGKGSRWMHFFSPEITFALPQRPNAELLLRLHHRSGVFGLVSDAWGGAQYGAVGLRIRF